MENNQRNIITIATGKKVFVDLAVNLARSFRWWHADTDINFQIVTDMPELIDEDIRKFAEIVITRPGELGEGFSPKLHLDKLSTEGQTLFIDSDCLIFGSLENVFDKFKGHSVSVVGGVISEGEWFGDIASICRKFSVPHLPKFNGGIYYLEKGEKATEVYQTARELERQYDEIGFVRLRNRPNDEVLMALAMALHHQPPIHDDGTIMSDPQSCPGGYSIDVINGERWLVNPKKPDPLHQEWYPFNKVEPLVVHFLGYFTQHYPYQRESARLLKASENKLNQKSELLIKIKMEYPQRLIAYFIKTLRPIYRIFFGFRKIKPSERV